MTTFRVEDIWEEDSDLSDSEDTGNKTVGKIIDRDPGSNLVFNLGQFK